MNSKDLKLKMGTEEEKAWEDVKLKAEKEIKILKREIIINEAVIETAKKRIAQEKDLNSK